MSICESFIDIIEELQAWNLLKLASSACVLEGKWWELKVTPNEIKLDWENSKLSCPDILDNPCCYVDEFTNSI